MNQNLAKEYLIKKDKLNQTYYVQSLLQEAFRLNLLSQNELEQIQLQSVGFLSKQVERYTHGQSSSIKVETAQQIMQSVFYGIGVYLKSLPDTDKCIDVIKRESQEELFEKGKAIIEKMIAAAKNLLARVQDNRIAIDNYSYNQTIDHAIPDFFPTYDVEFGMEETAALIDYPLCVDKMETVGIEYIFGYLEKMYWENEFCQKYEIEDILSLLNGCDERWQDLLINVFQLVLTNAVGSVLLKRSALQLDISSDDRWQLQKLLSDFISNEEYYLALENAAGQLMEELDVGSFLTQYIPNAMQEISVRLQNAVRKNQLNTIFVSLKRDISQAEYEYQDGKKMDDESFRKLTEEIRQCSSVSDKIAIIQSEVHSLIDLVDILGSYCFFDNEYQEVFCLQEDAVLAMLMQKLPTHTLEKFDRITQIDADFHGTECEKEWQNELITFLKRIEPNRLQKITALSEKIAY